MAEVSGIKIKLPHGNIMVTLEEARELYESLDELFGNPVTINLPPVTVEPCKSPCEPPWTAPAIQPQRWVTSPTTTPCGPQPIWAELHGKTHT